MPAKQVDHLKGSASNNDVMMTDLQKKLGLFLYGTGQGCTMKTFKHIFMILLGLGIFLWVLKVFFQFQSIRSPSVVISHFLITLEGGQIVNYQTLSYPANAMSMHVKKCNMQSLLSTHRSNFWQVQKKWPTSVTLGSKKIFLNTSFFLTSFQAPMLKVSEFIWHSYILNRYYCFFIGETLCQWVFLLKIVLKDIVKYWATDIILCFCFIFSKSLTKFRFFWYHIWPYVLSIQYFRKKSSFKIPQFSGFDLKKFL